MEEEEKKKVAGQTFSERWADVKENVKRIFGYGETTDTEKKKALEQVGRDKPSGALEIVEGARSGGRPRHQIITVAWPEEKGIRPDPLPPCGRTIPEAFLYSCERMGNFAAH